MEYQIPSFSKEQIKNTIKKVTADNNLSATTKYTTVVSKNSNQTKSKKNNLKKKSVNPFGHNLT